ncbi:MAG: hypothetical protein OIF38_08380 [Cellvibrionaceae bacterium]|nr:hypothetical protein [Cellvibrionaceae bacterium]
MAKSIDVTAQPETRTFQVEITQTDRDALKAILPKLFDHVPDLRAQLCEDPAQEDTLDTALGLLASFLPLEDFDTIWDATQADDNTMDIANSIRGDLHEWEKRLDKAYAA